MKTKAIKYLDSLVNDNTTKAECDIIKYIKQCITFYEKSNFAPTEQEKEVIDYLNEKAQTRFQYTASNIKFIRARLSEKGVDIAIMKEVIDKKVNEWKGTKMQEYLRPETLFNATKFQSYSCGLRSKGETTKEAKKNDYTKEQFENMFDDIYEIEI